MKRNLVIAIAAILAMASPHVAYADHRWPVIPEFGPMCGFEEDVAVGVAGLGPKLIGLYLDTPSGRTVVTSGVSGGVFGLVFVYFVEEGEQVMKGEVHTPEGHVAGYLCDEN